MKSLLSAALAGVLFSLGLGLSGMTAPQRVLGFLDVTGAWDPSLAFVMGGALGVYGLSRLLILRRRAPVLSPTFPPTPLHDRPDGRLFLGAALFGLGWGLSGYCPGPAITSLATGNGKTLLFGLGMLAGAAAWEWVRRPMLSPLPSGCE
jgi:uncharacterized membrane protein YedE/YeeE